MFRLALVGAVDGGQQLVRKRLYLHPHISATVPSLPREHGIVNFTVIASIKFRIIILSGLHGAIPRDYTPWHIASWPDDDGRLFGISKMLLLGSAAELIKIDYTIGIFYTNNNCCWAAY